MQKHLEKLGKCVFLIGRYIKIYKTINFITNHNLYTLEYNTYKYINIGYYVRKNRKIKLLK